ncbi:protein WALLS ARE THIN 1-like [Humulus lupulus]|uniref:protein WALLS ARE THIN 1-like n=1 Tax=Humulus lupulus TaxID=3486 RepID=UPI002B4062A7|nr:protein WALLS ARE THIN 1-like [Humulus lupulus]
MADDGTGSTPAKSSSFMVPERAKLHMALTVLQFAYAGNHVFVRAALDLGVSKLIFPVYRNLIAMLLLIPFAYVLEKKERPKMSLSFLMQFFVLGLIGITSNQGFYLLGLDNTTPTFTSAIENAIPATTFIMAVLFRFEHVNLSRRDGKAKVIGTVASVAGATLMTLYKGPTIYKPSTTTTLDQFSQLSSMGDVKEKNWTFGCICLIIHCLSWSGWIVLQAPVLKRYPARLAVTSYTCFFGLVQFLAIAAWVERDSTAWKIHSTAEFWDIFYAGAVSSGMAFAIQIWVIDKGGPVFVSLYFPLQTLLVALIASLLLGEEFYLGGIIGAVLIISGLYLVVWGKSLESKLAKENADVGQTSENPNTRSFGKSDLVDPLLPTSNK